MCFVFGSLASEFVVFVINLFLPFHGYCKFRIVIWEKYVHLFIMRVFSGELHSCILYLYIGR